VGEIEERVDSHVSELMTEEDKAAAEERRARAAERHQAELAVSGAVAQAADSLARLRPPPPGGWVGGCSAVQEGFG
jgi:hypothetical protein